MPTPNKLPKRSSSLASVVFCLALCSLLVVLVYTAIGHWKPISIHKLGNDMHWGSSTFVPKKD